MKILDLVLKHKWYDMIDSGEKPEEYRDLTEYWAKRLLIMTEQGFKKLHFLGVLDEREIIKFKEYTHVRFHRGYTSTTMTFEIGSMSIGKGRENWGAENKEEYFVIKLGKRL